MNPVNFSSLNRIALWLLIICTVSWIIPAKALAQSVYTFPVDVRAGLQNGQVTVTHSPLDIGNINAAFDGIMGSGNVARSAGVNPLVVTLQFPYDFNISSTGLYTDNTETGRWSVESAGTLAELDNQSGGYLKLVDQAAYTAQSAVSFPVTATGRVLRLTMHRTDGDNYVHLGEWKIAATATIQPSGLCMKPNSVRLIPNAHFRPDWFVTTDNGLEFPLSSGLSWEADGGVVSVDGSGVFSAGPHPGESLVTTSWNGISYETKIRVVPDFSSPSAEKRVVKVALVIIDPPIPAAGGQRFSERFWSFQGGPMALARQTRDSMFSVSGGVVDYQFSEIHDEPNLLTKFGGTQLTVDSMYKLFLEPGWPTLHNVAEALGQSEFMYNELLNKYDLCNKSNNHEIDEVWVWAMPFIGMAESNMTGTGAFWINGAVVSGNSCTDLLPIMGFNYERYAGCALHNFTHRIETTMYRLFGSQVRYVQSDPPYPAATPKDPLQTFMLYDQLETGNAHMGNSHFPPNGTDNYDYDNPVSVPTYAPNWKRYPYLFDETEQIDCSAWGCEGDCGLNFTSWWMRHIPHFRCKDQGGRLNNWWPYVIDFNEGLALAAQTDACNCKMFDDEINDCLSRGQFPWHDWIAQVKMKNLDHASGKSPYSDFTDQTIHVNAGFPVEITLGSGFSYFTYDEYWKVWIDYNNNGVFEEGSETFLSLQAPRPVDGTPFYSVTTTAFILGGFTQDITTRMRVAMKRGAYPSPCEQFAFGEVEDYTIHIAPGGGHSRPDLSLINFLAAGSGVQGTVVPFTFDLKNSGTAFATGDYTIGAYLSTDSQLDAGDALTGVVQTGNTPIGTIQNVQGAMAIPGNLAAGSYFFILKADINNTIQEIDELNNLTSRPFTVQSASGGGADLELTLTADQTNPAIYSNLNLTLKVRNAGNQPVESAKIAIGVCTSGTQYGFNQNTELVYAGTPPPPAFGVYDQVLQSWNLSHLLPGQSVQLSFTLFTLTAAERKIIAFSYQQTPGDPDSQPGGAPANCTPAQDDEAVWTINAGQPDAADRNAKAYVTPRLSIFPNPATGETFIRLEPWPEQPATLRLYNQLGIGVMEQELTQDDPQRIDLSGLADGTYILKVETPGQRPLFGKIVVTAQD